MNTFNSIKRKTHALLFAIRTLDLLYVSTLFIYFICSRCISRISLSPATRPPTRPSPVHLAHTKHGGPSQRLTPSEPSPPNLAVEGKFDLRRRRRWREMSFMRMKGFMTLYPKLRKRERERRDEVGVLGRFSGALRYFWNLRLGWWIDALSAGSWINFNILITNSNCGEYVTRTLV